MQSRRGFLKISAHAATAVGFWPVGAQAQNAPPSPAAPGPVMNTLSSYMSAARAKALPEDVTEQAKYHLLDTLSAMISGSELPPGQAAQRYVRERGGNGGGTVVGSGPKAGPSEAPPPHGGVG